MIDYIVLKNIATYDNTGCQIKNLKKLNFFFGSNGSGKSTLAKFLYWQQNKNKYSNYEEATGINLNFSESSLTSFNNQNEEILVFDDYFVKKNFYENDTLNGIFTLHQKNAEIDSQIKTIELKIENILLNIEKKENNKNYFNNYLEKFKSVIIGDCFKLRDEFTFAEKYTIRFGSSKKRFFSELDSNLDDISTKKIKKIGELKSKYNTLYEENLKEINRKINLKSFQEILSLEAEINNQLNKIIIDANDIPLGKLIKQLDIKNWVEEGKKLLDTMEQKKICPFCQQSLNDEFLSQLEKLFDDSYKKNKADINKLKSLYQSKCKQFQDDLKQLQQEYNVKNKVSELYQDLVETFRQNFEIIDYKLIHLNEKKEIKSIEDINLKLNEINNEIATTNQIVNNLNKEKSQFDEDVFNYITNKASKKIEELNEKTQKITSIENHLNNIIEQNNTEISTLKSKIKTLRTQTINTTEAVQNINALLTKSGFDGFYIKEQNIENNIIEYKIVRNDDDNRVFFTLSEGEKNFIAFLYFYQLCIGTSNINSNLNKIIVIDDPVSSMDSQVLFIINALIQKLLEQDKQDKKSFANKNIEQVFIFTHNIYFYKEITFHRRNYCKDNSFYFLNKINNITQCNYSSKNIITDDYTLMWQEIKNIETRNSCQESISLCNIIRRIIESYLNFTCSKKDVWEVLKNYEQTSAEYYIVFALLAEINDESHKIQPLDSFYYQRLSSIEPKIIISVFKEIFSKIGEEHYNFMMQITK